MRIAVIGAGRLSASLGAALRAKGHHVVYGAGQPNGSAEPNAKTIGAAIAGAEVVVLATPWTVTEALVCEYAPALAGKIVIDATNPLNPSEKRLALGFDTSGAEVLQSQAHGAAFFKAFNTVGADVVAKPQFAQGKAMMLVAGPRGPQKNVVFSLVSDVGFEPVDAGELRAARLLEPMGMLLLELSGADGKARDLAFVLASRERNRIQATRRSAAVRAVVQEAG